MKGLILSIMYVCACVGSGSVHSAEAPTKDQSVIASLKQLEQDLGDAMVALDFDKIRRIFADDWVIVGSSGQVFTKEAVLRDLISGEDRLVSFELGPIDVQVFGDVAVAHASVTEQRIRDGRNASGEFVWMDLLEKRAGTWVIARSASARLK